jgi:hypothetical protein
MKTFTTLQAVFVGIQEARNARPHVLRDEQTLDCIYQGWKPTILAAHKDPLFAMTSAEVLNKTLGGPIHVCEEGDDLALLMGLHLAQDEYCVAAYFFYDLIDLHYVCGPTGTRYYIPGHVMATSMSLMDAIEALQTSQREVQAAVDATFNQSIKNKNEAAE